MPLAAAGAGDLEHDADAPEFLIGPLATRRPERPVTCSVQDGLVRRAVALSRPRMACSSALGGACPVAPRVREAV